MRKYHGIKNTVCEIKDCRQNCGMYYEVFYDMKEDEVFTKVQVDFGHTWNTVYEDKNIVKIGNFDSYVSMAELKSLIEKSI
jgi:hypothetical protein